MSEADQKRQLLGGKTTELPFTVNALQARRSRPPPPTMSSNANVHHHQVLVKRYLLKDHSGNVLETPEEMFMRVAKALAEVEYKFDATEADVKRLTQEFYEARAMRKNAELLTRAAHGLVLLHPGRPHARQRRCGFVDVASSLLTRRLQAVRPASCPTASCSTFRCV